MKRFYYRILLSILLIGCNQEEQTVYEESKPIEDVELRAKLAKKYWYNDDNATTWQADQIYDITKGTAITKNRLPWWAQQIIKDRYNEPELNQVGESWYRVNGQNPFNLIAIMDKGLSKSEWENVNMIPFSVTNKKGMTVTGWYIFNDTRYYNTNILTITTVRDPGEIFNYQLKDREGADIDLYRW